MAKPKLEKTSLEILENVGAVSGNILLNAYDPDGDTITIARVNDGVVGGSKGSTVFEGVYGFLTIQQNGDYTYTLNSDVDVAFGSSIVENFKIKVRDGTGNFDQDNLIITINGVEDAPALTTLLMDFEDFNPAVGEPRVIEAPIPQDYHGFKFDMGNTYNSLIAINIDYSTAPGAVAANQPDGKMFAFTPYDGVISITRTDNAVFNFESGYFSFFFGGSATIQFIAYNDGEIIKEIDLPINVIEGVKTEKTELNIVGADQVDIVGYSTLIFDNITFSGDWLS